MRINLSVLILGCLALPAWADHMNTDIHWPGWRVESSEELYLGRKYTQYPLTYLFDGDPQTAWVFSGLARGPDRKVLLTIRSDTPFAVDRLRIMNGYNKSEAIFARNNRVVGLRVILSNADSVPAPEATQVEAKLPDRMGWHTVLLARGQVRTIELEVTDLVKGPDDDVCVSGLELYDGDRMIDLGMPLAVLASDGDECGCGYESRLVDWHGKAILPDGLGRGLDADWELHFAPSRRLVAFQIPSARKPTICIFDVVARKVVLNKPLYWHTVESMAWTRPGTLEVRFPQYEVKGTPGGPQTITFTPPGDAVASPPTSPLAFGDSADKWKAAWAEGKTKRTPAWAGGYDVLAWPSSLPEDIAENWARQLGLFGRSEEQILAAYGKPEAVAENKSVNTRLYLYALHSISFHQGRCHACAPRSPNYERWSLQPDI
jgi:hypothetical protein